MKKRLFIGVSAAALIVALGTTGVAVAAPGVCNGTQQRVKAKDGSCQVAADQLRTRAKKQLKDGSCELAAAKTRARKRSGTCTGTGDQLRKRLQDGSCTA